jgi:hypothetical protein
MSYTMTNIALMCVHGCGQTASCATAKIALCCFPSKLYDMNIATTELTRQQFFPTHEPGNRQNEIMKQ